MIGIVFKTLLAAAFVASYQAAATTTTPFVQLGPLTEEARDAALAPLPGIKFREGPAVFQRPSKREPKDRLKKTKNYSNLHSHDGKLSGRLSATRRLGAAQRTHGGAGYENITAANAYGTQYGLNVTFGDQRLLLDLDTGSSDTWAFYAGTNCTNAFGEVVESRFCKFGPRYGGNFTHGAIAHEHLYVEYGDGESVEGPLGYMDLTVGGFRVRNQTVGLANETVWQGNNISSGVLGLAYPALTNAFYGPKGREYPYYAMQYSPVFSTMVDQGLVDDFFSVAINRPTENASAGAIGFGGVPEGLAGVDYDTTGQADIIVEGLMLIAAVFKFQANVANDIIAASDYSFYTIIPDGWYFGSSTDDKKRPYIVDTGTTLIYLPTCKSLSPLLCPPLVLAQAINNMFYPPAVYSFMNGGFLTTCDAVTPRVAVVIDGTPFYLNPEDLLFRSIPDEVTGLCMTAFNDGATGPFILGDVFLKNVLAVFDIGQNVLQFASRIHY
ncbi:hypothetical protein VM1G_09483 [Cytospora mali]|uniref:Peptidase A1 domain-containing protein n=1 Tax=Cytospora mali TaxID=578113 RepID=A0A194WC44_CYTMA|nr:hypothetical protein VM1G_09483 [Valsa mali]